MDTGSCVSTCSKSFYENNLSHLEILPLDNFVRLECANGEHMPYFGYIQVDVKPVGVPTEHIQSCILLVVPDTSTNTDLPILLGTNVLEEFLTNCRETVGDNFLQNAALFTPWYLAFRCITVRKRELKRHKNNIALVRCAESACITIPANIL